MEDTTFELIHKLYIIFKCGFGGLIVSFSKITQIL